MNRFRGLNFALLLSVMLPMAAAAQQDTRETKEGSKFIGLAMTKDTQEERAAQYQQALAVLRPAMQTDAANARVWFLAGQALAGLGELLSADSAFDRALELHPEYADDIALERQDAWITGFQAGVDAMEAGNPQLAVETLTNAELIYQGRPEALLYLGVLYANDIQDMDAAEHAFRAALEATQGPLLETLEPEAQQEWIGLRESLKHNIERTLMGRGVDNFTEQNYAAAMEDFKALTELNPYSRDGWFNYGQAVMSEARVQEEGFEELTGAAKDQKRDELIAMYTLLDEITRKAQEFDPQAEILFYMLAQTHTMRGRLQESEEATAAGQAAAYEVIQAHDALDFTVDQVSIAPADGAAQVTGVVKNRKIPAGGQISLNFTLLNMAGETVGQQVITVDAPAVEETATFEATIDTTGQIAGWRYTAGS